MAEQAESGAPEGQDRPGQQQMVFPTIGDPEEERRQEEAEQGRQSQREEPPELADMRERMRRLEETRAEERKEAAERERRMQQTLERLAQQPQQSAQRGAGSSAGSLPQEEEQEPELPDPINDPKGYNEALEKKIDIRAKRYAEQIQGQQQHQTQANTTAQQLWSKLQNDHPELSNHDLVVEGVARRELQRLQQSGVDPMQYAASDPDGFVGRIADESKRYLQQVGVSLEQGGGERPDPRGQAPSGRTAGIDGGEPQRGGGGGRQQQRGTSFVDELKGMQRQDGFF